MIDIPPDAVEKTLIHFVRQWLKLLAAGKWQEACRLIDEPNCYGIIWTPERVHKVVEDAFRVGCRFRIRHPEGIRFTDPDELENGGHPTTFSRGADVFVCDHNVPLNGEWSVLTAQFEFHRRPQGYAVLLHDLHVM